MSLSAVAAASNSIAIAAEILPFTQHMIPDSQRPPEICHRDVGLGEEVLAEPRRVNNLHILVVEIDHEKFLSYWKLQTDAEVHMTIALVIAEYLVIVIRGETFSADEHALRHRPSWSVQLGHDPGMQWD